LFDIYIGLKSLYKILDGVWMAKCKSCKTNIPEGMQYCKDCQDKVSTKANESYLDSLLNSVKNNPSAENIYKKKNKTNEKSSPDQYINQDMGNEFEENSRSKPGRTPLATPDEDEDDLYRVDFSDIEEFSQFDYEADLNDINEDIIIQDEDLFGESLTGLLKEESDHQSDVNMAVEKAYLDDQPYPRGEHDIASQSTENNHELEQAIADLTVENYLEEEQATQDYEEDFSQLSYEATPLDMMEAVAAESDWNSEAKTKLEEAPEASMSVAMEDPQDDYSSLSEDTDLDLDLDELLNSLDNKDSEAAYQDKMLDLEDDMFSTFGFEDIQEMKPYDEPTDKNNDSFETVEADQDDFLSLLSQVSDEDAVAEDIRAISDMLSGNTNSYASSSTPSDVGEVFSDALKAVSSLNDYDLDEAEILGSIPGQGSTKGKKGKKAKIKKEIKADDKSDESKPKLSLFKRLFSNVKDEKTAAKFEEELRKQAEPASEKAKKSKAKSKKGKASSTEEEDSLEQAAGKDKASRKAARKEKVEKKKKTKEIIEVIDEIEEDPGRINRAGAFVVFFFFGIVAIILIIGTNMITYTLSIEHATKYFSHRKYTQAYNEVYGVDIRDEDIGLYDKIQTVMFVNKQLNSYNNYYALEKYPEALDSLLKGLSRYEKYIELATMLGIEADLDYVRSQILAELNNEFQLTEEEAMTLLSYENMEDYSLAVYDVVLERLNN
jgi:hypothetical protein